MPPRDFILHAGQHKTGTTSVQRFLKQNRESLVPLGVHVPQTGQYWTGSHHVLVTALVSKDGAAASRALAKEVGRSEGGRVLISAEVAKQIIVEGRGEQLVEALRAAGARKVHILLYLRSSFAQANAAYRQRLGSYTLRGESFDEHMAIVAREPYFDYHHFLEIARLPDVELTVRPYSAEVRRGVTQDLLDTLGIKLKVAAEPRLNTSLGPIAVEAIRQFGREIGPVSPDQLFQLKSCGYKIGRSVPEQPFWCIDESVERGLTGPDRATEEFTMAIWGRPWREVIGEERRPLNMFDPRTADAEQKATYESLLAQLRTAASELS